MVSGILRRSGENLPLVVLEHTSVCLANDSLLDVRRRARLSKEWDFQKHAAS